MAPKLTDMSTWTGRTGKDALRSLTDEDGNFWFEQNATKTSKWAKLAHCSQDTALRDIQDLTERGLLSRDPAGGRSASYSLA